jgi:hypothetical protein
MYCKMESAMPDCDCEKILISTDNGKVQLAEAVFSPKWEEQIVTEIKCELSFHLNQSPVFLNISSAETVRGFPDACFHPPSLS